MIFNSFLYFCVIFVTVKFSFSQLVDQGTETTDGTITDDLSDVICKACVCTDGIVDCADRNITAPFELTDWEVRIDQSQQKAPVHEYNAHINAAQLDHFEGNRATRCETPPTSRHFSLTNFKPIKVDLSRNQLTSITRIAKLPIQQLNLSNCNIASIEDASFFYLEEIRTLDLSKNKISTSDLSKKVFCGPLDPTMGPQSFKYIQEVSLAYNDLHSLPQDLFGFMTTLTFLDLSGNPLAYIDQVTSGAMTDLINLKTLKLSGCELEVLPEGLLRRQRKLKYLDLSDNRFTTIPSVLQEAPRLTYLSLDKNAIQAIEGPNSISSLVKLNELSLCRMSRLQNVTAGALGSLTSLRILRMTHNPRLTNLDPGFLVSKDEEDEEQWPIIKELYLNNNNLSKIDSHYLDNWNDLEAADFSNNPYVCDCNNQWMVDVLTPLLTTVPQNNTINNMVCKKPADVRGLTFAQLSGASKVLFCAESENITEVATVSNLAILLGIMIGIIVTFPIVLILILLWRKGYFARCKHNNRKASYPDYYEEENEHL